MPNVISLLTANLPRGHGHKGGTAPRSRKLSQPVTRIEMSVISAPIVPSSMSHAEGFAPDHAALQFNMVQSPVYGPLVQSPVYGTSPMYPMCYPFGQDTLLWMGYPLQQNPVLSFTLCFITGNITTCIGCKNKHPKQPQEPYDLCIKHQEWRQFMSLSTATSQSKFGNAYYHCQMQCVWMRHPNFVGSNLQVPSEMIEKLSPVHKHHVFTEFRLNL